MLHQNLSGSFWCISVKKRIRITTTYSFAIREEAAGDSKLCVLFGLNQITNPHRHPFSQTHLHTNHQHPPKNSPQNNKKIPKIPPQTSKSEAITSCTTLVFERRTQNLKTKTFCFWLSRTENLSGVTVENVICKKHVLYIGWVSHARTGHGRYVHLCDA